MSDSNLLTQAYSVVVTTIGEDSLHEVLESIAKQSIPPSEIIVVDDSKSQNIELSDFRIMRTGGFKGPSFARNLGIQNSQNSWVALADSDDIWDFDKISIQFAEIIKEKLDFSLTSAVVNGKQRPKKLLEVNSNPFELLYSKPHILRSSSYFATGTFMFNRDKVKVLFDEQIRERENIKFLYEAFISGSKIRQSAAIGIQVAYDSKKSISRMVPDLEYSWWEYLSKINLEYARNFSVESMRNAARTGNMDLIKTLKVKFGTEISFKSYLLFYFICYIFSIKQKLIHNFQKV